MKNEPNTGPKRKQTYSSFKNIKAKTLSTQFGIDKKDFLNEKTEYKQNENGSLKLKDNTLLDDYDFIIFKFASVDLGTAVNFRATLNGISENISPSWDSAKFIGSPFNYYTYNGIERSLTFSFKVYSLSPVEHIACWQRLNYLTGLAYPQRYPGTTFIPPFIKITIGNLYKNKECFIESLSYTIDDNTGWEIGSPTSVGIADNAKFKINGEETSIDNYKLPTVIDVNCTVKLVESRSTVQLKNYYGFDKLPRTKTKDGKNITTETTTPNAEKSVDINNNDVLEQLEVEVVESQPKENVTAQNAPQSNPGSESSTEKKPSVENSSTAQTKKPINYRIEASNNGDGFTGRVYADGVSIFKQDYVSTFSHFSDKEYKGADGVKETLKFQAKHFGFYSENGKYYEKSDNIN